MKYLNELTEGDRISGVYLCKKAATLTTKNGKEYISLTLMDKTANTDAKIWEPNSDGIGDFDELDYIFVTGDVTVFNGAIQVNLAVELMVVELLKSRRHQRGLQRAEVVFPQVAFLAMEDVDLSDLTAGKIIFQFLIALVGRCFWHDFS